MASDHHSKNSGEEGQDQRMVVKDEPLVKSRRVCGRSRVIIRVGEFVAGHE